MKLHSAQFEKAVRRGVKEAVRESSEMTRAYCAAQKVRTRTKTGWVFRLILASLLGAAVAASLAQTHHPATGLAVISLWGLCLVPLYAQILKARLYAAPDLPALFFLPITEGDIFRWECQVYLREVSISLFDFLIATGVLASVLELSLGQSMAALVAGLVSCAMVQTLALFCVARLPRLPYNRILAVETIGTLILIFCGRFLAPFILAALDPAASTVNAVLPTGWALCIFGVLLSDGRWVALALVVPLAGVFWTIRDSLARLQVNYVFREPIRGQAADLVPERGDTAPPGEAARLGVTAIEEIIESRQFLTLPAWSQPGWFEGHLWRWLTVRERVLAEFVYPAGFAISKPWWSILRNFALTFVAAGIARSFDAAAAYWFLGIGLFVTFCQVLARLDDRGRAFKSVAYNGLWIPFYAGYPVGYRELSSLLIKCTLLQAPLCVAYTMASGATLAYFFRVSLFHGLTLGFRAGILICSTRFILIAFAFSSGTNDSSKFSPRTILLLFFFLLGGGSFLVFAGSGLLVQKQWLAWLLCAAAVVSAFVFHVAYGRLYHRGRFDLMTLPRR